MRPRKPSVAERVKLPSHDVLIIGAGLAGQRAALAAAETGVSVAIMSKVHPVRSHSVAAAGGINAAVSVDDDWRSHAYDTVKGSDFLGDQDAIEVMCSEAPKEVLHLEHIGVTFHRNDKGELDLRAFGGASVKRTAYVADITGQAILHVLYEQLMKHHETVDRYEEWFVTAILQDDKGDACGAIARNIRDGRRARVPMGLLFTGPMGTGKTFVAEAFAKESGLTAVKFGSFRSKWVGATESNLERILDVLSAMGQVIVFIDEVDRALAGNDGSGDGGTESRVIARLKEFMADPKNRGRILFVLMTNRPDRLDTDIKRTGRLDRKIPFFYAQTPEEVEPILKAQLRRHKITLAFELEKSRALVSARLVGYSNAEIEGVVLLAASLADTAGRNSKPELGDLEKAIADFLPSRDVNILEFMELLAVFEASNRSMLPKKYAELSPEELSERLAAAQARVGNRR